MNLFKPPQTEYDAQPRRDFYPPARQPSTINFLRPATIARSLLLAMLCTTCFAPAAFADDLSPISGLANRPQTEERLSFQTQDVYRPRVHLNADVAMVYGIDKTLPDRIKTWRDKGYIVQVMTGVSWGEYQDYYFGRWDGKHREDEAQQMKNGEKIGHGGDVYY